MKRTDRRGCQGTGIMIFSRNCPSERKIAFSAMLSMEDSAFLDPLDISTIFGNALDNAIEASEKLPEERRAIVAKAGRIRDILVVSVENNALPEAASCRNPSFCL